MKENKAVYVTNYNISEDQLYKDHQLYNSRGYRDYSPRRYGNGTKDVGVQFDEYCTCENISALRRRHQEVRYFSGQARHVYTYHGSRSFTDIGVGSIKAFQRKKIKRIYLPETDDRGVGSADLSSLYSRRTGHNRGISCNDQEKTTSKGVGGVSDGTVVVLHEKLSPIVRLQSKSTSPTNTAPEDQKKNVEIGSNTYKKSLVSTATQMDDNKKKEDVKIEVRKVKVSIEQEKEPSKQIVKEKICKVVPRKAEQKERIMSKRAQEAERVFSSDSLVQHIHNLEMPSEEKHSPMSIDPMENKLEREYRKMFSAKSKDSRDSKVKEEQLQFDLKSTSVLRRRFEALRRGLAKKEDSKKNAVVAYKNSSNVSEELSRRDVSIASDPPSLEGRSFSQTKVYSPYPSSNRKVTSNPRQDFRRSVTGKREWARTEEEESDCQGVKAMFKLWGKKFNLEDEEAGHSPKVSKETHERTIKPPEPKLTIQDSGTKKEGKKFFFFKKKSKDKPKQPFKQKKGVTAGRCEVGDGLMIKIGAANSNPRPPAEKERKLTEQIPEEYEDMIRKAWLQQFMARTIESRRSLKIRWNNNAYATSSSTIFEIMENVYIDTGVIFRSRSEITTGSSSSYRSYTKHRVNFVQDIEAWMIPNFIPKNITPIPTVNSDISGEANNNIQVRISDQKWIIDKSGAFAHKIELVLHSRNVTKIHQDPSSEYLTIDIPKGFFSDSSTDSGGPIHTSNEEVYKIVEYESPESNTRLKKIKKFENLEIGNNLKDIKVTVSIKNSSALESKILETVIKTPSLHRDVVNQDSNVYISKRCNVIGVGIITQKEIDRIKKPIFKKQDEYSEEDSDHSLHMSDNKSKCAESYLQDDYRHWTPLGMDLSSWCNSDSQIQCCSDNSNPSVNNQGDGTKSCPNIYDDYQASTVVSSCGISCCSHCVPWEEEIKPGIVSKLCNRLKAKNKIEPENSDKRVLPKDSVEVFRKRKLYALSNKSNWTFAYEIPNSVPSIDSIGGQDTLIECPKIKKTCYKGGQARVTKRKFCKKHVSLPDCDTLHDTLLQQINSSQPSGILSFKASHCDACKKINNPCPKHATVIPTPTIVVPAPRHPCQEPPLPPRQPSVPSPSHSGNKVRSKQSIKQVVIKQESGESLQRRPCLSSPKPRPIKSPCCSPPRTPPKSRSTSPCSFTTPGQPRSISPTQSQSSSVSVRKPQPTKSCSPPCDSPSRLPCGSPLPSSLKSPPISQSDKSKPSSPKTRDCSPPDKPPEGSLPDKPPEGEPSGSELPDKPTCGLLPFSGLDSLPITTPCNQLRKRESPMRMPCESPISSTASSKQESPPGVEKPKLGPPSPPKKNKSRKKLPIAGIPSPPPLQPCCPEPKPPSPCASSHGSSTPPSALATSNKSPQLSPVTFSKTSPSPARIKSSPPKPPTPTKSQARSPSPPRKKLSTSSPPCGLSPTTRKRCRSPLLNNIISKIQEMCSSERVTSSCSPPTPPLPKSSSCLTSCTSYNPPKSPPCLPCLPKKSPPSPPKSPPCPGAAKSTISPKRLSCESCKTICKEFPWPLKNQISNQSINSSCPECKTDCVRSKSRESIPPKVFETSFIKPDFTPEDCEIKHVKCPSKSPCNSPKKSGTYVKKKHCKKACSKKCMTTVSFTKDKEYKDVNDTKCPCPNNTKVRKFTKITKDIVSNEPVKVSKPGCPAQIKPSDDNIIIKIKKETDSIAEIREGLNIKVQDFDGKTLYERRDYTIKDTFKDNKIKSNFENITIHQRRPSLLNDMYKNSHVHVVSTSRQVPNEESEQNSKIDFGGIKSTASVANLIVINFKLKIFPGDKTTELNIGTDDILDKPKYDTKSHTDQASQQVYLLKDEAEQCTEDFTDKNNINIKIVIKNYKPKSKNKLYSEDFSQNIAEKMNTVSTGYSDILSDNRQCENADNVYSVHRATVNLASSNEVSKTQIPTKDVTSQECIEQVPIVTTSHSTTEISAIEHSESKEDLPCKDKSEVNAIHNIIYKGEPANYSSLTDTDEQDLESDLAIANDELRIVNSVDFITKALTRDEKRSLLEKVFEKAAKVKKIKNKEKMKQIQDVLKLIFADSRDHDVLAITSNDLVKEMTYASLKPNYFRDTDSMNNYYKIESSVASLNHGNHDPNLNHPTANLSQCSIKDSEESSYEEDKPEPCICSALAARLNVTNGGGCCCKNPPKADEETFCDLRTEEDFLLLNYKTIEYIDVETQNSKYFCNSNNISVHSKAVSGSFRNAIEVCNFKNEETATMRVNFGKKNRKNYANCVGHRQPCELKKLNRNTMLGISDEDKVYLLNAKPTNVSIAREYSKMTRRDDLESVKHRKRTFAKYERPADILQSYETKKAVLEIYAESTKSNEGERIVAKLPKFVYGNESAIEKSNKEYAEDMYEVANSKAIMMSVRR